MKKFIYIIFFFFTIQTAFAQNEPTGEGKLREKMVEYIQTKLGLSRIEAEKFQPVFVNYFKELIKTHKEFKSQGLEYQQKIVELRLRYREQFKPIVGEKRSNEVFDHEREFLKTTRDLFKERQQERRERRADNEKNSKLFSN